MCAAMQSIQQQQHENQREQSLKSAYFSNSQQGLHTCTLLTPYLYTLCLIQSMAGARLVLRLSVSYAHTCLPSSMTCSFLKRKISPHTHTANICQIVNITFAHRFNSILKTGAVFRIVSTQHPFCFNLVSIVSQSLSTGLKQHSLTCWLAGPVYGRSRVHASVPTQTWARSACALVFTFGGVGECCSRGQAGTAPTAYPWRRTVSRTHLILCSLLLLGTIWNHNACM